MRMLLESMLWYITHHCKPNIPNQFLLPFETKVLEEETHFSISLPTSTQNKMKKKSTYFHSSPRSAVVSVCLCSVTDLIFCINTLLAAATFCLSGHSLSLLWILRSSPCVASDSHSRCYLCFIASSLSHWDQLSTEITKHTLSTDFSVFCLSVCPHFFTLLFGITPS